MTEELLLMIASAFLSVSALALSIFNLQHLEVPLKRAAAIIAEALRLSEPLVPALRNSQIDNYIREILKSFSESDPFFRQSLEATGETAEHVADVLPLLDPSLQTLGKAISLPTDQARSLMSTVVHRVKDYDNKVQEIRADIQRLLN